MANFDENTNIIEQADTPFIGLAVKYGLIGGLLFTAWTLLAGVIGLNAPSTTNYIIGTVAILAIFIGLVSSVIKTHRNDDLGGHISLGRAFLLALISCIVTGVIGGLAGYVYYNHIDPAAMDQMVEYTAEMMEGYGLPEDQMEEAVAKTRDGFGLVQQLISGGIMGAILGGIVSIITAAIMKKEVPMV